MQDNPISATVDFANEGVQHGHLKLPFSHDQSAWGSIMIPITVVQNGQGPTVLLTGGNHGDEYEGPVALYDLATTLKAEEIQGRVIIVPAMNLPAFKAGTRTSPYDKANMNRIFPGKPDGTVSEKIADYFQRTLLPMADFVLDIHSGGKTLDFIPFCAAHELEDKFQQEKCVAAMNAFNAPYSLMLLEVDAVGMYDTAAEEMGKIFISTELGGGGSATAKSNAIAKRGVNNLLRHAGILCTDDPAAASDKIASIQLDMPDGDCFISCLDSGLLEYCVNLGDKVQVGQVIAKVHDINHTGRPAQEYRSLKDGVLLGRHFPGLINIGDVLGVVAVEV
ncbi:MAG: N(2)-acetyl-L-2,4-diaminobutanoate deacetylase DoeB [Alphaproteobacteria bacterium]|nr:N(2)-acetyl-L-2,4-diaminobutanoate deacetylase DoeB [Alphaproteobacteria bacterium]